MKITQSHLTFYRQQKAPAPSWAKTLKYPNQGGSIHELINAQVDRYDRRLEATNLVHLIRSARQHFGSKLAAFGITDYANLQAYLYHLAFKPYSTDKPRRTAYAKKWYARLYTPEHRLSNRLEGN